jgi:hypothetical protein
LDILEEQQFEMFKWPQQARMPQRWKSMLMSWKSVGLLIAITLVSPQVDFGIEAVHIRHGEWPARALSG